MTETKESQILIFRELKMWPNENNWRQVLSDKNTVIFV